MKSAVVIVKRINKKVGKFVLVTGMIGTTARLMQASPAESLLDHYRLSIIEYVLCFPNPD